jgi:asparagine synthase (glutamine-hydrolysing)
MCGIVGISNYRSKQPVPEALIHQMCDTIVHRGPNAAGYYQSGYIGMGMRRLAIIDVKGGQQPIANEDKTVWIVFNGEIYNHNELRKELKAKGHLFQTSSDTETILHLYEEEDVDCLQFLRGMFAFCIWDSNKAQLFIARDRLGIKPLFWSDSGGRFLFASEMKALLVTQYINNAIDWNGLDAYFAYGYLPAPLTIYSAIHKLPSAHYMLVKGNQIEIKRYWDLSFKKSTITHSDDFLHGFEELFANAVKMRLMSEVPLGAFLSGGIDSGLVVAMMSNFSSNPVNSFTVGFGGSSGNFLDERPYAREISTQYLCSHSEKVVIPRITDAMNAIVRAFDEPFADDGAIPMYHICEEAKKKVTVVLTGLGGDENFAGYERYMGMWLSQFSKILPGRFWSRLISPLLSLLNESKGGHNRINHIKRFASAAALPAGQRYQNYMQIMTSIQRRKIYTQDVSDKVDFEYVDNLGRAYFERLDGGSLLDRSFYQDFNMYMPEDILALSDRIGMHFSIEIRVPFVDHKLVEYCAQIPSSLKIKSGEKKYLLKKIAKNYLPMSAIKHRKQGFCSPMAAWLNSDLRPMVESALHPTKIKHDRFFSPEAVHTICNEHYSKRSLNDKVMYALLMFQNWLKQYKGK